MTPKTPHKTKYLKSDIAPCDLFENGKRVSGLPTIFDQPTRKSRKVSPPLSRADGLVGDARINGKKFRGKAPIYKLIEAKKKSLSK